MGIIMLILTLCRIFFLIFNSGHFPVVYFTDFLVGMWFDLVTISIAFLPLVAIEMLPNKWRGNKWFQYFLEASFHLILLALMFINMVDIEYFRHTASRSNYALIKMLGYGNDLSQQLPSFIGDYWYLFVIGFFLQLLGFWLYRRSKRIPDDSKETSWLKQIIIFPITVAILVLVGRGGLGMKPIAPANAAAYTIDQNVQLVLNSAFTMIKSWGGQLLEEKEYFPEDELEELYTIRREYKDPAILDQPNIVLLTLESFSVEYISSINGESESYTPFLDSLIGESLVFTNCYANGKKSMDAVPALVSSIPKLMEMEYLTSNYSINQVQSLPKILHDKGYESGFFHGATNGSMNFEVFSAVAGFDDYYGRTEYDNDEDFDGTWGIFDEEFLVWSCDQFDQMKKPFFSTIFTLSSHPPYTIPARYGDRFNKGPEEMHNSVRYADHALRQFFNCAKTKSWYDNTLFIIVADHTPASATPVYYKDMGNMHIPLVFYHPTNDFFKGRSDKVVGQTTVMPSILHLMGHHEPFAAFGKSAFDNEPGYSSAQIGNKYLYFGTVGDEHYMLLLENEEVVGIFNLKDLMQTKNLKKEKGLQILEKKLKAMIQTYNHALITNQMTLE